LTAKPSEFQPQIGIDAVSSVSSASIWRAGGPNDAEAAAGQPPAAGITFTEQAGQTGQTGQL